jgi:nucleotide-binding universal stress UspA family protein
MEQQTTDSAVRWAAPDGPICFPRVLCAVDGTAESFAAVEQAAALAGPEGQLTLLAVTSFEAEGPYRGPAIGPLRVGAMLQHAAGIAEQAGVESIIDVDPASPPSHVVLDWAADRDLLAMGAPTTSWFGGMFAGGVAVAAESSFTTPLLIARHAGVSAGKGSPIVVASDGQAGSEQLVLLAGRLARDRGARVILVHATGLEPHAHREAIEHQAQLLEELLEGDCELRMEAGRAHSLIDDSAVRVHAALIVMGSRRLKGPRALGSVSRRVVHRGPCSVLLAPQELLDGSSPG